MNPSGLVGQPTAVVIAITVTACSNIVIGVIHSFMTRSLIRRSGALQQTLYAYGA